MACRKWKLEAVSPAAIVRSYFVEHPSRSFRIARYISSTNASKGQPFPVTYLKETIGLSPESAISVSKRLHFKTADNPNSVVAMFRDRGFSHTQLQNVVRRCPVLLDLKPEKILLPKLEFFYSKGASASCLIQFVSGFPSVLTMSLEKILVPSFEFLHGLLKSEEEIFRAMQRFAGIVNLNHVTRNVQCLQECGVPDEKVRFLLRRHPRVLVAKVEKFRDAVKEVKEMGFNPVSTNFVVAVVMLRSLSKSTREDKANALRTWGWSEEELSSAFKCYPGYMGVSKDKITAIMDHLVNKLHLKPSMVAKCPSVLSSSLKERIIPRASVAQALVSKGLLQKDFSLSSVFKPVEDSFLQKYVHAYEDEVPDLLKMYMEPLKNAQGCTEPAS